MFCLASVMGTIVFSLSFFDLYILFPAATVDGHATHQRPHRKTLSHVLMSVTTNRAQQGVNREQRRRGSTVAYQQASAVPKPPAAVLSSQHEREGLTIAKKNIYENQHIEINRFFTHNSIIKKWLRIRAEQHLSVRIWPCFTFRWRVEQLQCTDKRFYLASQGHCVWKIIMMLRSADEHFQHNIINLCRAESSYLSYPL